MVRPGSGRFGVGFWVGFWVGLRARDFPTERVLSRTPLIIRTVDQKIYVFVCVPLWASSSSFFFFFFSFSLKEDPWPSIISIFDSADSFLFLDGSVF